MSDDAIVPDASGASPGRGAWVHPTRDCVERAIRRRAFGRALRTDAVLDPDRILALIDSRPAQTAPGGTVEEPRPRRTGR